MQIGLASLFSVRIAELFNRRNSFVSKKFRMTELAVAN